MSRRRWKRAKARGEGTAQERAAPESEAGHPGSGGRGLRRAAVLAGVAAVVVAVAVSGFVLLARSGQPAPKALIVDQLDQTSPNPDFVKAAGTLLKEAGYDVYYTPGAKVTVDYYRGLGRRDYDVIILRSHVARVKDPDTEELTDDLTLFTSEPYTEKRHVDDQQARRLTAAYYDSREQAYFGVQAAFIRSAVRGDFDGATVIVMGCDALRSDVLASAFVDKGATAVIGWDGPVSAEETDSATERLLRHLVADKHSTPEAVAKTMAEVGPDLSYSSSLRLYPAGEAGFALP